MADPPGWAGRVHHGRRRVRLADVHPSGRLRSDAAARYLQDVAADDVRTAGLAGESAWVVRRTVMDVAFWPRYDEVVDLSTWCSGVGAAWAERRTTIGAGGRVGVETASLWVSLDPATMRPVPPSQRFAAVYGAPGAGRRVRTRLSLPLPAAGDGAPGRPWPLRRTDLDLLGHVNNAVAWAAVEDEVSRVAPGAAVTGAEIEHRAAIELTTALNVRSRLHPGVVAVWLVDGEGAPLVSARVQTAAPGSRAPSPPPA
jgi:acyl-ACP thioesterase